MTVEGKLYGIPESLKAVVFWYNKDLLATPPATTDELKALMEGGTEVSISFSCYHYFGFYNSFGGKIFDENWKVQIEVTKVAVDCSTPEAHHQVDALAGATITSRGVENSLKFWLSDKGYGPYLSRLRHERS